MLKAVPDILVQAKQCQTFQGRAEPQNAAEDSQWPVSRPKRQVAESGWRASDVHIPNESKAFLQRVIGYVVSG